MLSFRFLDPLVPAGPGLGGLVSGAATRWTCAPAHPTRAPSTLARLSAFGADPAAGLVAAAPPLTPTALQALAAALRPALPAGGAASVVGGGCYECGPPPRIRR